MGERMPRIAKELTAVEVRRLLVPGLHPVGTIPGLRLRVKPTGAKSWVLRTTVGARRAELGLGGYPGVTLAQAFERARDALDSIRKGIDPAAERRSNRETIEWTFKKTSLAYIADNRAGWKNPKHAQQWENTLATYAYPVFGDKHVRDVNKGDVLACIRPIWTTKNETADRLRNRIELVLKYAVRSDLRPEGPNPASWRECVEGVLPPPSKVAKVEHHAALAIDDMHAFMQRLHAAEGMGARALEFAILTAARSGEVRGATWQEFDLQAAVWSIPKGRMKSDRPHRVPLSDKALELLEALPRMEGRDLLFTGQGDKPLSDMTLTAALRRMKVPVTAHGFRSTFRDWCAERTATPNEVAEMALAHAVGDATEAAYRRGDLFEKRRELMELWAKFIDTPPPKGNVRALRSRVTP
jgi:integrase